MERTAMLYMRHNFKKCLTGNVTIWNICAFVIVIIMFFVSFYLEGVILKIRDNSTSLSFPYLNFSEDANSFIPSSVG